RRVRLTRFDARAALDQHMHRRCQTFDRVRHERYPSLTRDRLYRDAERQLFARGCGLFLGHNQRASPTYWPHPARSRALWTLAGTFLIAVANSGRPRQQRERNRDGADWLGAELTL